MRDLPSTESCWIIKKKTPDARCKCTYFDQEHHPRALTGTESDDGALWWCGEAERQCFVMGFLVSLIVYLGTITGIVLALLLPLCVLLSAPSQSTVPHQTAAMERKSRQPAAATTAITKVASSISPHDQRGAASISKGGPVSRIRSPADGRRGVHTANAAARKQFLHMLDRQERTRPLAYQQELDFASRYGGYVDDPSGDRSLVR
jgi:hypothetical protein